MLHTAEYLQYLHTDLTLPQVGVRGIQILDSNCAAQSQSPQVHIRSNLVDTSFINSHRYTGRRGLWLDHLRLKKATPSRLHQTLPTKPPPCKQPLAINRRRQFLDSRFSFAAMNPAAQGVLL